MNEEQFRTRLGKILLIVTFITSSVTAQQLTPGQWRTFDTDEPPAVNAILANPANRQIMYAATSRGVFRSVDFGISWIEPHVSISGVEVLTMIHANGNLFAGTQTRGILQSFDGIVWTSTPDVDDQEIKVLTEMNGTIYAGTEEDGIFLSIDGGTSWLQANEPLDDKEIDAIVSTGAKLFTGGTDDDGVFVSLDDGVNWQPTMLDSVGVTSLLNAHGRIYAATNAHGIFFSDTSDGFNWTASRPPLNDISISAVIALTEGRLIAGSENHGIFVSLDRGETWESTTDVNWENATVNTLLAGDDSTVFAGTLRSGVLISTDRGTSWRQAPDPMHNKNAQTFLKTQNTLYVGTFQSGIFRSNDNGNRWFRSGGDLRLRPNYFGSVVRENFIIAYAQEGVFKSEDFGFTWQKILNHEVEVLLASATGDTVFAATEQFGVFSSFDAGRQWRRASSPLDVTEVDAFLLTGNRIFAGADPDGVLFSEVGSSTWVRTTLDSVEVRSFLAAGGRILAATSERGIYYTGDTDGVNWQQANVPSNEGDVTSMIAIPSGRLIAGTIENGIWLSDDNGENWVPAKSAEFNEISVAALFAASDSLIFAGTLANGILRSTDRGENWERAHALTEEQEVLTIFEANDVIYAGLSIHTGGSPLLRIDDQGRSWTPLDYGLTSVTKVRDIDYTNQLGSERLYIATDNGFYLQNLDLVSPIAKTILVNGGKQRFTSSDSVNLALDAEGADFMVIAEDSNFTGATWQAYDEFLPIYELSAEDGVKNVYVKFRDHSWNESQTLSAEITLDQTKPDFSNHPHSVNSQQALGEPVVIQQQVDEPFLAEMELWYRRVGEEWSRDRVSFFDLGNHVATIDPAFVTANGLDYRIIAKDLAGNESTLADRDNGLNFFSLPSVLPPTTVGRSNSISGGTTGSAYRIISIPMQLPTATSAASILSDLGEYGPQGDWRFYSYDGGNRWREGSNFAMHTGSAYFIILREPRRLTNGATGSSMLTSDGVTGRIDGWQLRGGDWTLVGNPFLKEIKLSQLTLTSRKHNGEEVTVDQDPNVQVWIYEGMWQNVSDNGAFEIEPWRGVFVFSIREDTLIFADAEEPFETDDGEQNLWVGKDQGSRLLGELDQAEWVLQLKARCDGFADEANYFGMKKNAMEAFDRYDWYEPPILPGGMGVSFPHENWETPVSLSADIRPVSRDGARWEVEIEAGPGAKVELRFEALESAPTEFRVLLIDEANKITRNLREQARIETRIPHETHTKQLVIIAGSDAFISKYTDALNIVPNSFALRENYPNPFNPSTTIRYELPSAGNVSLKLFDMLGAEVRTLEDGTHHEAGYYEAVVDMRGLASGVYIYKIRVEGAQRFQATKKMIYVK